MKISKKTLVYLGIAVVLVIVAVFGIQGIRKLNAEKSNAEYGKKFETITDKIIYSAADTETCGNLIINVWHNSIFETEDSSTDKFTKKQDGSGDFYDDFNDALATLFNDSDFANDISSIRSDRNTVTTLMKQMKNPPEDWEDSYDDLKDYYDDYIKLTNLVINPTGSYNQFSSSFYSADTDVANYYDIMKSHVYQVY